MKRLAIAYTRADERSLESDEAAAYATNELEIVAFVIEPRELPPGGPGEAPSHGGTAGLGDAFSQTLERIAAGDASTLLLPRLAAAASSGRTLLALVRWLESCQAHLVALDVGLDTRLPSGRQALTLVRELDRLGSEPLPRRPLRGRPGLAERAPHLGERIVAMREVGLSLQAIADTLNLEGVPTPRGGARWRPSSVQTALGYRRPRPPLPGAPPPPSHAHHRHPDRRPGPKPDRKSDRRQDPEPGPTPPPRGRRRGVDG